MVQYEVIILFIDCFAHRDTVVNSLMKESEILSSTDAKLAVATPASVSPMLSPDEMPSRTEAMSITQDGSEATQSMTNSIDTHTPIDVSWKSFGLFTLPDSDSGSDCKLNGYICTFHIARNRIQIPNCQLQEWDQNWNPDMWI